MEDIEKLHVYFAAAINSYVDLKGRGIQTSLRIDAGITDAYLSQILSGKRKGSLKTLTKIARASEFKSLEEAINIGRMIVLGGGIEATTNKGGAAMNDRERELMDELLKEKNRTIETSQRLAVVAEKVADEAHRVSECLREIISLKDALKKTEAELEQAQQDRIQRNGMG